MGITTKLKQFFFENGIPFWAIYVLALVLWAQNAWVAGFFHDGHLYAAFGKHMAQSGNWLVPSLSKSLYNDFSQHSPFIFILEGLFFKVIGHDFLQARLFGVLWTMATLVLLVQSLRRVNLNWAFFAGLLFCLLPPLMKKTRFPNMDLPLMFFQLAAALYYLRVFKGEAKAWLKVGLFMGLGMLTKGPMIFLVASGMFAHLLWHKKLRLMLSPYFVLAIILSLFIFSLWPLSLKINGQFYIFEDWFRFIFLRTAVESRGDPSPFWTYLVFLLKQAAPWILFCLWSLKKVSNKDSFYSFWALWFTLGLLLLSFAGFKYSHYLIPLYPPFCIWAASSLVSLKETFHQRAYKVLSVLAVLVPVILCIFPIQTTSGREKEIFSIMEQLEHLPQRPKNWTIVEEVYPYFALANVVGYVEDSEAFEMKTGQFKQALNKADIDDVVYLVPKSLWDEIQKEGPPLWPLMYFEQKDMVVLIANKYIQKDFQFRYR